MGGASLQRTRFASKKDKITARYYDNVVVQLKQPGTPDVNKTSGALVPVAKVKVGDKVDIAWTMAGVVDVGPGRLSHRPRVLICGYRPRWQTTRRGGLRGAADCRCRSVPAPGRRLPSESRERSS